VGLAHFDKGFSLRWFSFFLWLGAVVVLVFIQLAMKGELGWLFKANLDKDQIIFPVLVFVFSCFLSFLFLENYPFVALGDQIRDGGLNAYQIATGEMKDIFSWGRYESHGLIIPIFVIPFYYIFGNSVFSYRAAAALVAVLSVMIVYFLMNKFKGRRAAIFGSLILLVLPLHFYFSRTEIVVIFSSFLTSLILFLLFDVFQEPSEKNIILLSLICGFASGFHASVRTVVFLAVILTFVLILYLITIGRKTMANGVWILFSALLFFLVGFGPRILNTSPDIFFHTRTVPVVNEVHTNFTSGDQIFDYIDSYVVSLKAYVSVPLGFHSHFEEPILPLLFSFFFIFGFLGLLFGKYGSFSKVLVAFVLIIPFTNSAVTNCLNCDHRLAPLLPIAAIVSAFGIDTMLKLFEKQKISKVFSTALQVMILSYIGLIALVFFDKEYFSQGKNVEQYLSMYIIRFFKERNFSGRYCLRVSPENRDFLNLMHCKEQRDFLIPNIALDLEASSEVDVNEVYVSRSCCGCHQKYLLFEYCKKVERFRCPLDTSVPLRLYVENSLLDT